MYEGEVGNSAVRGCKRALEHAEVNLIFIKADDIAITGLDETSEEYNYKKEQVAGRYFQSGLKDII